MVCVAFLCPVFCSLHIWPTCHSYLILFVTVIISILETNEKREHKRTKALAGPKIISAKVTELHTEQFLSLHEAALS